MLPDAEHTHHPASRWQITNALKFEEGRGVFFALSCSAGGVVSGAASPPKQQQQHESSAGASSADEAPPPTHVLEARVTDHGRGLSPQECERVFDAYEAASASRGGGTGLGLYSAFERCAMI
jgi:signal transduction histidine kinase